MKISGQLSEEIQIYISSNDWREIFIKQFCE